MTEESTDVESALSGDCESLRPPHTLELAGSSPRPIPEPGLSIPTFRLSTLMIVMAITCMGLALMKVVSPFLSGLAVLLLLLVFAHVLGNALGTQLRQSSRHAQPLSLDDDIPTPGNVRDTRILAPQTRLSHRSRLGLGTKIMTGIGAVLGAIGGGWLLWWSMKGETSTPAMGLGVVSCGVLGGFVGFAVSSLLGVLGGAVVQAHEESVDHR